jgi:hypothetical protein
MPACEEKRRLATEFASATKAYSEAAQGFRSALSDDRAEILDEVERTHKECAAARRALQKHMVEHCC